MYLTIMRLPMLDQTHSGRASAQLGLRALMLNLSRSPLLVESQMSINIIRRGQTPPHLARCFIIRNKLGDGWPRLSQNMKHRRLLGTFMGFPYDVSGSLDDVRP